MLEIVFFKYTCHRLFLFRKNTSVSSAHITSEVSADLNTFVNTVREGRFEVFEVTRGQAHGLDVVRVWVELERLWRVIHFEIVWQVCIFID